MGTFSDDASLANAVPSMWKLVAFWQEDMLLPQLLARELVISTGTGRYPGHVHQLDQSPWRYPRFVGCIPNLRTIIGHD